MKITKNEKGFALILAMVMLALLSVLGAYALSTSSTELFISGNYRNSELAFYSSDAGIDYGQVNDAIYSSIIPGTTNTWPVHGAGTSTSPWDTGHDFNTTPLGQDVKVQYLSTGVGKLCAGSMSDTEYFQAYYFLITSVGTGPGNSRVDIESQVCRIVPKSS